LAGLSVGDSAGLIMGHNAMALELLKSFQTRAAPDDNDEFANNMSISISIKEPNHTHPRECNMHMHVVGSIT
jgi:hypothetical protein